MNEIQQLLPHRDPFLFVDRIEEASQEKIVAYRTYTDKEFFFQGHFPGYPVVPGVVLIETMAQAGGAGIRKIGILPGDALFFLATVDKAKFRRQVRPNEEVKMVITNQRISPKMLKQSGQVFVGEEIAAEAEWMCLVGTAGK